jgi:hypothetical protein
MRYQFWDTVGHICVSLVLVKFSTSKKSRMYTGLNIVQLS